MLHAANRHEAVQNPILSNFGNTIENRGRHPAKINYICGTGRRRTNRNARAGRNNKEKQKNAAGEKSRT